MGISKSKNINIDASFHTVRIGSLNVNMYDSAHREKQIESIVRYYASIYQSNSLDVLCLQGIRRYCTLKKIIVSIRQYQASIGQSNNLHFYPDINDIDTNESRISVTTSDEIGELFDKLIITRHEILQCGVFSLRDRDRPSDCSSVNGCNDISVQLINLCIYGYCVSLYNIDLSENCIGIGNAKDRAQEIIALKRIIERNKTECSNKYIRMYTLNGTEYTAINKNIHIVVGSFHVNRTLNDVINKEYINMLQLLNSFDIHAWIYLLKHKSIDCTTSLRNYTDSYILMHTNIANEINDNKLNFDDKNKLIINTHCMLFTNALVLKKYIDMSYFINYPLEITFVLQKTTSNS